MELPEIEMNVRVFLIEVVEVERTTVVVTLSVAKEVEERLEEDLG